jgi:EAL domain-containing protein (putative c-di-GMP-specific phosphodiesterase class I)
MDELRSLYAQIQEIGRRQITVDGKHIPLSISGGAMQLKSLCAQDYSIRSCLAYAQEKSKQEHHSQLVIFDNELEHKKLKSLEVLETIRQSVLGGCDGFYLCYQPIVNPDTAKTVGMEALLRFCKEPYGEIMPGQFIEWLEQDECFFELGNWILRRALTDGLEFVRRDPDFKVNVNVSYSQLDRGDFLESLLAILEETGFPPENLYIELTERCQISDLNRLKETLDFFGTFGIRIALDDFGTGTASLNLLRSLPIGCLKIDHTFLANIETNERDRVIVDLIINSANRLGMSVCLEGVENEKICAYVKRYKAVVHQGYYYSRPVRLEAFRQYVSGAK